MRKSWFGYAVVGSLVMAGCVMDGAGDDSLDTVDQASQVQARVFIGFEPGQKGQVKAAVASNNGQLHHEFDDVAAIVASVPQAALAGLANNPHVRYIEEDVKRFPSSLGAGVAQSVPYGIPMVQADQLSDATAGNRKICIIDSGYSRTHEDLSAAANVNGTNLSGTGNWYEDTCGHGTHVAGTIAALQNGVGVVGVLPSGTVGLHIVKVFDGEACAWTYSSTLINAANACQAAGANVINMSLGGGGSSVTENNAFQNYYSAGILSIAAAGNGGTTSNSADATSYPAGYSSVVSVAAIDQDRAHGDFSQENSDVELAAPGVGVLSTLPWGEVNRLTVGTSVIEGKRIDGAARSQGVSGVVVDGDQCTTAGAAGEWTGKVVLCQRGTISFNDKVVNVKTGGGVAAVLYNNLANDPTCADFSGTLGDGVTSTIPAIAASCADGATALAGAGTSGTVASYRTTPSGYDAWNGTSMAAPHVAGVAALVWSLNPTKTNGQLRTALQGSAADLGAASRDISFGYGLVQAKAAHDLLQSGPVGDVTAPVISKVSSVKTNKAGSFSVSWTTDEASTTTVRFDGSLGTFTNTALVTSHKMSVKGVKGVKYTYYVSSTDAAGNRSEAGPNTHQN